MNPIPARSSKLAKISIVIGASMLVAVVADAQRRGGRFAGARAVEEPFRGVIAAGKIEPGLFKIESTGVTTAPVVEAAKNFLDGLSDQQRSETLFSVDDPEWRMWDNRHAAKRQGVGFDKMSPNQRELAFGLMRQSLSAKGLKLSQDIMKLNGTLAELTENFEEYGEWLYWITIMGEPSMTKPWGWQLDGHHLVINYFVLGDQVVMSPVFVGSEPISAKSGKFAGTIVMQDEQDLGLEFAKSLSDDQRKLAVIAEAKGRVNALSQAYKDNLELDYAGIPAAKLEDSQRTQLLAVIESYIGNMRDGHARVKMSEVKEHLDRTYFAWIGEIADDSVFYYRIHSPIVLIEFDHERRLAPFRTREATRDHIHAVIRTPNGNDYGKDLLRQHYEQHHQ